MFETLLARSEFQLTRDATRCAQDVIEHLCNTTDEHFGNGRVIRNFVEHVQQAQADRLARLPDICREDLIRIEDADVMLAGGIIGLTNFNKTYQGVQSDQGL
jgi:hypothetical protein